MHPPTHIHTLYQHTLTLTDSHHLSLSHTQAAEFCSEHEVWKLNVAHVFFMQETKFKDSIRYYDPIVKRLQESLVDVTAIVLANLCVSYIMTSQVSTVRAAYDMHCV